MDEQAAPNPSASARAASSRSRGRRSPAGVLMRSRTRAIASISRLARSAGPGSTPRNRRLAIRLPPLPPRPPPVALEAVCPEPPPDGDPRELVRVERGPDPEAPGGEGGREVRAAPGVLAVGGADQHRAEPVARVRHEAAGVGTRLEAGGPHPAAGRCRLPLQPLAEAVLVDQIDGNVVGLGGPADDVGGHEAVSSRVRASSAAPARAGSYPSTWPSRRSASARVQPFRPA